MKMRKFEISMSHFAAFEAIEAIDYKQRGCREESQSRYGEQWGREAAHLSRWNKPNQILNALTCEEQTKLGL